MLHEGDSFLCATHTVFVFLITVTLSTSLQFCFRIIKLLKWFLSKLHINEQENVRKCTFPAPESVFLAYCHWFTYTSKTHSCLYQQCPKCGSWNEWVEKQYCSRQWPALYTVNWKGLRPKQKCETSMDRPGAGLNHI